MTIIDFIQDEFPNLKQCSWRITSDPDDDYNCIAWAAGCSTDWWWPDPEEYWPPGAPFEETVAAFVAAYETVGYAPCDDGNLEVGFEKVALFAVRDFPTHASRQLQNGHWTSKLGYGHDIEHDSLDGVAGTTYGSVVLYLKRKCIEAGE